MGDSSMQSQPQAQRQRQPRWNLRSNNRKAKQEAVALVTAIATVNTSQVSHIEDSVSEELGMKNLAISEPNSTEGNPPPPMMGLPTISADQILSKTKIKAIAKAYRAEERERRKSKCPGTPLPTEASDMTSANLVNLTPTTNMDTPMQQLFNNNGAKNAVQKAISRQNAIANGPSLGKPFGSKQGEAIVRPSEGSGGVPTATDVYLTAAQMNPVSTHPPRHIMVVIDLNGTILYRPSKAQPTRFVERPHARQFLKYCVDTFTVVIWSSAREQNVRTMCKAFLTNELEGRVTAVWGRDKFGLTREDYNSRVQCYKRLTRIWQDPEIRMSHPNIQAGEVWDQSNTVLIDDSYEKARSEPYNLIAVPEFFGDKNESGNVLPQVHDYINWLSCHTNVSSCIKARPFKAQ